MSRQVQSHLMSVAGKHDTLMNHVSLSELDNIHKKDRVIDIDNLQGICIYIVFKMKYPHIISEFFLIRDFISRNVELSSRSIFLNVLKGGIDFLLNNIEKEKQNEPTNSAFFESIILDRRNTVIEHLPQS